MIAFVDTHWIPLSHKLSRDCRKQEFSPRGNSWAGRRLGSLAKHSGWEWLTTGDSVRKAFSSSAFWNLKESVLIWNPGIMRIYFSKDGGKTVVTAPEGRNPMWWKNKQMLNWRGKKKSHDGEENEYSLSMRNNRGRKESFTHLWIKESWTPAPGWAGIMIQNDFELSSDVGG